MDGEATPHPGLCLAHFSELFVCFSGGPKARKIYHAIFASGLRRSNSRVVGKARLIPSSASHDANFVLYHDVPPYPFPSFEAVCLYQ